MLTRRQIAASPACEAGRSGRRWWRAAAPVITVLALLGAAMPMGAASAAVDSLTPGEGSGAGWCTTYGTSGVKGLYNYDNVYACGPDSTVGPTPFDDNGTASFQCVELSERFLWAVDGLEPIFGSNVDGATLASLYHSAHPSIAVGRPGPSSLPQPGDVISFGGGGFIDSATGHTAVVVSGVNSSGNFTIMSENWASTAGEQTVHIDMSGGHNGYVQFQGSSYWNTASFLELGSEADTEMAFQANTTSLWTVGTDNHGAWNLGMMKGTSPGISDLATGGYEVAFQANTGDLWTVGASNHGSWGQAMMAGTSPSIAGLSTGGYEAAFQASTGSLYAVGAHDAGSLGLGMMARTSPAIAAQPGGGYVIAFQANTGDLYVESSASGVKNVELGMMAGTSPAIAELPGGGYVIAFQANTGDLWVYSSVTGAQAYGLGMMAGTSPSIAALPSGGYVAAFQANTGNLYLHSTVTGNSVLGLGMYKGTSPAIATLPGGGVEVAFEANTTSLYTYVPGGGARNLELGMLAGTSPAIS
jgi:CHAP domain